MISDFLFIIIRKMDVGNKCGHLKSLAQIHKKIKHFAIREWNFRNKTVQ